jgi:transcriptional regulator GlxA family with amidase domain
LLKGRRVATHWTRCAELARRHPDVIVERDPIFIRDGDVWTSAGVTAGIDLALALVEQDLGRATALAVARQLVVFLKRPGGQAQFSAALSLQQGENRFGALHGWISQNLRAELSLPDIAARAGMSERTFVRRYREETGCTPAKAVERLRVEAAQRRLCDSRDALKRIASACGFGSADTMRRSFLRVAGVLPHDYRRRFSG